MRAAIVACRNQTTTRRARSAAIAHATADRNRPTIGSGHPARRDTTASQRRRDPQRQSASACPRRDRRQPPAPRAAMRTSAPSRARRRAAPGCPRAAGPWRRSTDRARSGERRPSRGRPRSPGRGQTPATRPATTIARERVEQDEAQQRLARRAARANGRCAGASPARPTARPAPRSDQPQNDRLRGSPDRPATDHVRPNQMAPAPPSSSRLRDAVSRTTDLGLRAGTERRAADRSGGAGSGRGSTMTQPVTVRRQSARVRCRSAGATKPRRAAHPPACAGETHRRAALSPAPSNRVRKRHRRDRRRQRVFAGAIAAPAAARDRTCSTATVPTRRPSAAFDPGWADVDEPQAERRTW